MDEKKVIGNLSRPLLNFTQRPGAAILVSLLWTAHLVLNIVGWSLLWSIESVYVKSNPPSPLDQQLTLYRSTFWDNVKQFWNAGAQIVAVLIVFGGLVQPIVKAIVFVILSLAPISHSVFDQMLSVQEFTSKLSLAPFYVEAILLLCLSYTFVVKPLNLKARVFIETEVGLVCFMFAQLTAFALANVLRVLHRARTAPTPTVSTFAQTNRPSRFGPEKVLEEEDPLGGGGGGGGGLHDDPDAMLKPLIDGQYAGAAASSASGASGGLRSAKLRSVSTSARCAEVPALSDPLGPVLGDGPFLRRDSAVRQWRRDVRRAALVLPMATAAIGCFAYCYWVKDSVFFGREGHD